MFGIPDGGKSGKSECILCVSRCRLRSRANIPCPVWRGTESEIEIGQGKGKRELERDIRSRTSRDSQKISRAVAALGNSDPLAFRRDSKVRVVLCKTET